MENTAYLVLENGKVFQGKAFGAPGEVIGETVFTTGMTGYLETLTDRSYFGQIVVQTFPLVGNYGVIPADFEGGVMPLNAYIVKRWCREPSNFRSEGDLDALLKANNIVGLCEIDTRALTKLIRESGVMNGKITTDPKSVDMDEIKSYKIKQAVTSVGTLKPYRVASGGGKYQVCLFDFGAKENIIRELVRRDCDVTVLPPDSGPETLSAFSPNGILLSNGPGDPSDNPQIVRNLREIMKMGIPIFGICLGHLLLALANGFQTSKMKYGHHGANQPVKDTAANRVYITSQNHGYAVVSESVDPAKATELFVNVNDGTCEGLEYRNHPAFSAQFHPQACAGPQDTAFLFDRFIRTMGETVYAAR